MVVVLHVGGRLASDLPCFGGRPPPRSLFGLYVLLLDGWSWLFLGLGFGVGTVKRTGAI